MNKQINKYIYIYIYIFIRIGFIIILHKANYCKYLTLENFVKILQSLITITEVDMYYHSSRYFGFRVSFLPKLSLLVAAKILHESTKFQLILLTLILKLKINNYHKKIKIWKGYCVKVCI